MQLCECCKDYCTCRLDKRVNQDTQAPCNQFLLHNELSQQRYERIVGIVRGFVHQAQAKDTVIYQVDAPLELTGNEYPHPNAWVDFVNVNLDNEKDYQAFHSTYIQPYFETESVLGIPDLRQELMKAQATLHSVLECSAPVTDINTYVSWAKIRLIVDEDGIKTSTEFGAHGAIGLALAPIGLFCVQAAQFISKKQHLKRCPVCGDYFVPGERGPKPRACEKPRCVKAMSRNPERYFRKNPS